MSYRPKVASFVVRSEVKAKRFSRSAGRRVKN